MLFLTMLLCVHVWRTMGLSQNLCATDQALQVSIPGGNRTLTITAKIAKMDIHEMTAISGFQSLIMSPSSQKHLAFLMSIFPLP